MPSSRDALRRSAYYHPVMRTDHRRSVKQNLKKRDRRLARGPLSSAVCLPRGRIQWDCCPPALPQPGARAMMTPVRVAFEGTDRSHPTVYPPAPDAEQAGPRQQLDRRSRQSVHQGRTGLDTVPRCLTHWEHLQHLVAVVVDDFYGDLAGLRRVEWLARSAVELRPLALVDLRAQGLFQLVEGAVGRSLAAVKEVCVADEEALAYPSRRVAGRATGRGGGRTVAGCSRWRMRRSRAWGG
jgi:hypothetical protein